MCVWMDQVSELYQQAQAKERRMQAEWDAERTGLEAQVSQSMERQGRAARSQPWPVLPDSWRSTVWA